MPPRAQILSATPDPIDAGREGHTPTPCLSAIASNEPCQTDGDNLRRCQICGFIVDLNFKAEKPGINFSTVGRGKKDSLNSHALMLAALVEADRYIIQMGIHGKWGRDCLAQIRAAIDAGRGK